MPHSKPKSEAGDLRRSGLSETSSNNKTTPPATSKVRKLGRGASNKSDSASPSPLQNSQLSVDRSPRSVDSKQAIEHRSPKTTTTPDRQARPLKGSELQAQLNAVQEDLKKTKEKLTSVEKEKTGALNEVKEAKQLAEEINEKLAEALVAQKRAEESLEIEKFRADELEQADIEVAQKREEEWQKELESVRNQHAVDVAALLSATQELQRVKHELSMITDAKNTALSHADDAMKIADTNAEKVELLSGEVIRLKALVDSKLESKSIETAELVKKLDSEVETLKQELERTKGVEEKLHKMEALVEGLQIEVADAKMAESDTNKLVQVWKKKAELLDARVEEANESEKSSRESLALVSKKLDESNVLLQDAESEIAVLKGKVESLEIEVARYIADLNESNLHLDRAQQGAVEIEKEVEVLKSEIKMGEEAKMKAIDSEKATYSEIERLIEEKNKLINELEIARDEGEKVKKAMEGLASALHEVSSEARETKESLLTKQAEIDSADAQIEEMKLSIGNTRERYEVMLDEANCELVSLKSTVEKYETEAKNSRAEWDEKELSLVGAIKKLEEEKASIEEEMGRLVNSLKVAEHEVLAAKAGGAQLLNKLKQAESEVTAANEAIEEAKMESIRLKDRLLGKENELQSIIQENDDLRIRESAALQKVKELSALLQEVQIKMSEENEAIEKAKAESLQLKERLLDKENELQSITQENYDLYSRESAALEKVKELSLQLSETTQQKSAENGDILSGEKEYEVLQDTIEIPKENADEGKEEDTKLDEDLKLEEDCHKVDAKLKENGNDNAKDEQEKSVETEAKDLQPERKPEAESLEDELDSKLDADSLDQINGLQLENTNNRVVSPTKQTQQQKKKKALLHKFGSLLKKKSNHK